MEEIKIGISGDIGSFSEQAAAEYCRKKRISNYELEYLILAENVLSALDRKEIDLGIFPIENSNGGVVIEAVHAMSRHVFRIKEMFEIPVIHCLLARPGAKIENIKKIASHDQALKQCKMYLRRKWPAVQLIEWQDTARAAKDLSEGKLLSSDSAVLAPESCATLYGLMVMEKGVQDLKFNFTNFIVAKRY